ncbi:MAG: DUF11 domain-containing protein [Saprospiraceae bacterium]|nr:DUF11 domain-containing protein [Saprospiraceae bacterium]
MKRIFWTIFIGALALGRALPALAQCQPATDCAAVNCVFSATVLEQTAWSNSGYVGGLTQSFCGTVESSMLFVVLADSSGTIQVTLNSSNCENGNGMQMALYPDCPANSDPVACSGGASGGASEPVVLTANTNPGQLYYLLVDGYSGDVCDFTLTTVGISDTPQDYGIISGQVLIDTNLDCLPDSTDIPTANIPVHLSGMYGSTRPTNAQGEFYFVYTDTGAVTLTLQDQIGDLWTICADSFVVNPAVFPDSTYVQFLIQPQTFCTQMEVELSVAPFFRPCWPTRIAIQYCNTGTVAATDATVELVLPSIFTIDNTNLPIASQTGDTLTFAVGVVPPFHCGTFFLDVHLPCTGNLLGQTFCLEAHVYPDSVCVLPSNWSGAHVELAARCLGDTLVEFTLRNTGTAAMAQEQEYIIIEDEVVLRSGNFQLGTGASMILDTMANGATWRMEAGQEPGHPGFSMPSAAIEGCGGLTPGLITVFPQNDLDKFVDIECRTVVSSYDPNLKTASPEGVGPEHLIRANTPLEYTIHFQNTGTDTAFLVRLVDVLPPTLDPLSFRPGGSSHPCTWQIVGTDTLEVLFSPIILPDSNKNELASHGWFEFSIRQMPDLPSGTLLENRAAIYFDYNDPVITDAAWHRINPLTVSIDTPNKNAAGAWALWGNPTVESCLLVAQEPVAGSTRFELLDEQGRLLRSETFSGDRFEFQRQQLPGGLYFFRLIPERGLPATGKIILR